jgi:hypothetical protein
MAIPQNYSRGKDGDPMIQEAGGNDPRKKNSGDKSRISLYPLELDEAVRAALSTGVAPKKGKRELKKE